MYLKNIFTRQKEHKEAGTNFIESDNLGTRHNTLSLANAYWFARMSMHNEEPYLLYKFDRERDAKEALLALPCIHIARDSKELICTKSIVFGYYKSENGVYEAIVCGHDLTFELWEKAKSSFIKHGGKPKGVGELEPEKTVLSPNNQKSPQTSQVSFVRKDSNKKMGETFVYLIYKAPDAASAKAFLQENLVQKEFYYLVVETPEGNYCRDIQGMYRE